MLELGLLAACVIGACWFLGAVVGGVCKLAFGLFSVLLTGLVGVLVVALTALLVVPVLLLALLPLLLPVFGVLVLVWLAVHASRARRAPPQATHG